ncbi:MAG TPA: SH3 domain-containing protein [Sphingomonadaceae bacterium]|nr:SH3 domain-containing protein [Sphingomonadaceae bacterium]
MRFLRALLLLPLFLPSVSTLHAQEREVPYWASLRSDEVNMRVGPSGDYPIDWVYHRQFLPVKVIRTREGWRLVQDWEGTQGWMSASLLSPDRTALVIGEGLAAMRGSPDAQGALKWNAEPGVVGTLGKCENGWCEFDVGGRKGWVLQERLWGAGEP